MLIALNTLLDAWRLLGLKPPTILLAIPLHVLSLRRSGMFLDSSKHWNAYSLAQLDSEDIYIYLYMKWPSRNGHTANVFWGEGKLFVFHCMSLD